jgi:adenylate cyclase
MYFFLIYMALLFPYLFVAQNHIVYLLIFLLAVIVYFIYKTWMLKKQTRRMNSLLQTKNIELINEKSRTEQLLANVFPKETASELKTSGRARSRKYNMATVLFSDIQGFTRIAEQTNPEILIDKLDTFFYQFDTVIEKYNIEKIKTIGDAYMCAGGIPYKNRTNPIEVILAALEMQQYMQNMQKQNRQFWDLRIGIHTGPVIAGVIGQKKLSYDIWGDTVNVANRMEAAGKPNEINISEDTHQLVKDYFLCEHRGKIPVKYKGSNNMYFIKGIRPELSINLKTLPNKRFLVKLQLLRLNDIEEVALSRMKNEIPENLFFHNLKHTIDVYTQVELIARAENVSEEDVLLLRTAALFHDMGFIYDYDNAQERSKEIAKELLIQYQYSEQQINKIFEIIDATAINIKPKNRLEEIICDANLSYLGRVDYTITTENLYKEQKAYNKTKNRKSFYQEQINFFKNHNYYTNTAKIIRDIKKEEQLRNLQKVINEKS